ncbi:membrane protein [Spirochaetia bacterium]|nr:membrane protein [Spirochaetia bacterium]
MLFFYAVAFAALFLLPAGAGAEEFFYKYEAGDTYRIISTVKEDVYLDRQLNHRAEIMNRIAVRVISAENGQGQNSRARHEAVFQTSERAVGGFLEEQPLLLPDRGMSFQWAREYESMFDRDRLGYMTIEPKYYMPMVRDVPVFPDRDLKPGDTWTAAGHEMYDLRDNFGIEEPYRIPFSANYKYLGSRDWKGRAYPAFSVSYRINAEPSAVKGRLRPRKITEAFDQIVYWDLDMGQPVAYEETFRMLFELSDEQGKIRTMESRGTAQAEIIESERMDKKSLAEEITGEIKRLGLGDTSVRVAEEGIVIGLDNIQFQPDSAVLLKSEQEKLDKIGDLLRKYPNRDILVGGHVAPGGTEAGRQKLSQERAATAAEYLINRGVRTAERVVVRGYGAERPIADNRTAAGQARNRRVEITILEN